MKKLLLAAAIVATFTATGQTDSIPAKKESGFKKLFKALGNEIEKDAANQKAVQDSFNRAQLPCGNAASVKYQEEGTAAMLAGSDFFSYIPQADKSIVLNYTKGAIKCYRPETALTLYSSSPNYKWIWYVSNGEIWILEISPSTQNKLLLTVLDGLTYAKKGTKTYVRRF